MYFFSRMEIFCEQQHQKPTTISGTSHEVFYKNDKTRDKVRDFLLVPRFSITPKFIKN